jgi:hypothetical protein
VYANQFRAMFVMNCKVNTNELLSVPEQSSKKKFKKGKNSRSKQAGGGEEGGEVGKSEVNAEDKDKDKFHPVSCEECSTVVGVRDFDEVYHFFNVLASQP